VIHKNSYDFIFFFIYLLLVNYLDLGVNLIKYFHFD
jgi:hypothetical protein